MSEQTMLRLAEEHARKWSGRGSGNTIDSEQLQRDKAMYIAGWRGHREAVQEKSATGCGLLEEIIASLEVYASRDNWRRVNNEMRFHDGQDQPQGFDIADEALVFARLLGTKLELLEKVVDAARTLPMQLAYRGLLPNDAELTVLCAELEEALKALDAPIKEKNQ